MLTIENIEKIVGEKIHMDDWGIWKRECKIGDLGISKYAYVFYMVVREKTLQGGGKIKQYEHRIILNRVSVSNWDGYYELSLDGYIGKITIHRDKILNRKKFVEIMGEMVEVIVMSKTNVGQIR